jgi:alpha 1,3-glucosidase
MRFCRDNINKTVKGWEIDGASAVLKDRVVRADVLKSGKKDGLELLISQLEVGFFRIRVEPTDVDERDFRFDITKEPLVFTQEVVNARASISYVKNATHIVVSGSNDVSVAVELKPFRISLVQKEKILVILNSRDQFLFEHNRSVQIPDEHYLGYNETHPNGPSSLGVDFVFPSKTIKLTGMTERNEKSNIADTVGAEATRAYNHDGYSWYGNIQLLLAHDASSNFGIFWPNPSDTYIDYRTLPDGRKARFISETNFFDVFVIVNTPKEITDRFQILVGRPAMPPLWAFGFHQSKWGYKDQPEIEDILANYDSHKIPLDVMWLDIDHLKGRAPFEYDHEKFPHPEKITNTLAAKQRTLVRINDCHLPVWADHIQYQEALKARYFVRLANGKDDWQATCWPGLSSWPDFLNETVRDWYATKLHYGEGRDFMTNNTFIWNDMNEVATFSSMEKTFPKDGKHLNGLECRETHSIYGLTQTAATFKGLLTRDTHIGNEARRPFVLSRGYFAGSQRYTWVWTGDNSVHWEHLRYSIPMTVISGLVGMPFIGEDIGGFMGGDPTEELEVRWYQLACWIYPFFRNHCSIRSKRREPFLYKGITYERILKAIKYRYTLLAVWYTHSIHALRHGRSPIVPLWYEWPEIESFHENDEEALLADSLLVVPVLNTGAGHVHVVRPPGIWYDLYSGDRLPEVFDRPVTMDETPVYLRGGRIVPLYETPGDVTFNTITSPLTLLIGGDENARAEGFIYLDDGVSYQYEKGVFLHRKFTLENGVVKSTKVDSKETTVPALLENCIVTAITVYLAKPDGTTQVVRVKGLNLKLAEEWSYSIRIGASARIEDKGVIMVIGIVVGAVVVVTVVVALLLKRKKDSDAHATYKRYT